MRVKVSRAFAGRDGIVIPEGERVDYDDDADAYNLIHAGVAEPPLRLRSAIEGLIGRRNVEVGELVDMPVDPVYLQGRDRRLEPLAAVVPAGESGPIAVVPDVALRVVSAGGRYATREEAEGLDLGGRDRLPKPKPAEPTGPTTKMFLLNGGRLPDGRLVEGGSVVDVADPDVDDLAPFFMAERCVKARVLRDGVVVGNHVCSEGEVVDVPRSILAARPGQLERIGPAEMAAGKVVDVLGAIGEKAAELVGKAEAAAPAERATKPAGKRPAAAPGPGDAR